MRFGRRAAIAADGVVFMMQRLIAGKNAIFGRANVAPLQTEIVQELVVERAEMLLIAMGCELLALSPIEPPAASRPE